MTKEFLSKTSKELFWSFWLGIPYLIWIYSIVIELNKKIPKYQRLTKILLVGLTLYSGLYILTAIVLLISGNADMDSILPYHFGAMFYMFLLMILASITIIRFEKAEKLKESSGVGLFFGIWYCVIGVWYIQPKLNKYIKRIHKTNHNKA